MQRKAHDGDHVEVVQDLWALGHFLESRRPKEGESAYREALAMARRLYRGDNEEVARLLRAVTHVIARTDRLAEAESLAREAMAMDGRLHGPRSHEVLQDSIVLSQIVGLQGRRAEVERLTDQMLKMSKEISEERGEDAISVFRSKGAAAAGLGALGVDLLRQGRLAEAESVWRECLAMRRRINKGDDVTLSHTLSGLATTAGAR